MSWAKVDDQWFAHRKVIGLSLAARGLWTTTLSWSCAHRTDQVPGHMVKFLAQGEDVQPLAEELVESGMWHPNGDGWLIHDWAEYQEKSISEKRAEAGRKGGKASGKARREANDEANGKQNEVASEANDEAGTRPGPSPPNPKSPPGGNGKPPFEKRLANELREHHGSQFNARDTLHASFMDLLREALDKLPEDRHHNVSMGVITRFVEEAQGIPISSESRSHTANLVRTHDPLAVLDCYGEALRWGAGIDKQYADDALSLSKYVAKILANRTAA